MTTLRRWAGALALGSMTSCPTPRPALPPEGTGGDGSTTDSAPELTTVDASTSVLPGESSSTGPSADSTSTGATEATTGEPEVCMLVQRGCEPPVGRWDATRWPYRRRIDVMSPLEVPLSDVVVPIRLPADFEYACAGADEPALYFESAGIPLDYEIEQWSPGLGAVVWVRIPMLEPGMVSGSMYYGHRLESRPSVAEVWSEDVGFEAVFHFADSLEDARGEHDGDVVERNAVSAYNDGRLGRAVHFEEANVGSRIALDDVESIDDRVDMSGAFTVTAWIRPTPSVTSDQWLRTVISRGSNAWAMMIVDEDDGVPHDFLPPVMAAFFSACDGGMDCGGQIGGAHLLSGDRSVVDDEFEAQWHHIALVYERLRDESPDIRKSLYVDGELDAFIEGSIPLALDALANEVDPQLVIGSGTSGVGIFHGDIDEVHIASEAWTPEQIAAEFELVANEGLVSLSPPECQ